MAAILAGLVLSDILTQRIERCHVFYVIIYDSLVLGRGVPSSVSDITVGDDMAPRLIAVGVSRS